MEQTVTSRGRICLVCKRNQALYACPRCNIPYCSLPCYKAHSNSCTESFYKENVEESLRSKVVDVEDRRRMMEILERVNQEREEDLEEMEGLEKLDLDDPRLEDLTPDQLRDFKRAVACGALSQFVEPWEAWWDARKPRIREVGAEEEPERVPAVPELPTLSSLTKVAPSGLLRFHVLDVLYSYSFVMRIFNGEPKEELMEAVSVAMQVSSVLSSASSFDSVTSALQKSLESSLRPSINESVAFSISVIHDVGSILSSKRFVLAALSDLHQLFGGVLSSGTKAEKKKLEPSFRKLHFFLVWANEQQETTFSQLRAEVLLLWEQQRDLFKEKQSSKKPPAHSQPEPARKPPKIQEID